MKTNRHHNVPLSLGGNDVKENIITIGEDDHKLLHETLDIPYPTVRRYRAVMNNMPFLWCEGKAKAQTRIEQMFFSRLAFLPTYLQIKIYESLILDTARLYEVCNVEFVHNKIKIPTEGVRHLLIQREMLYHSKIR